jgi:hypothetical protein
LAALAYSIILYAVVEDLSWWGHSNGNFYMGIGIKSLFTTMEFVRGDVVCMTDDNYVYLFEVLDLGEGSYGYDVNYLIYASREPTSNIDWVGPLTLISFKARKIA